MRKLRSFLAALTLVAGSLTVIATVEAITVAPAQALDNGLALTPPMGSNNWNLTGCKSTFNESFMRGIADAYVTHGLREVGYKYVNIDDCWALPQRNAQGNLVPDPVRFPSGIKALADYVHAKGLKFGIYTSAGTKTCNTLGFPGGLGHEQQDANLFASWGVDYLKYDNCNNQGVDAQQRYKAMRDALLATGRPIVYSICEWGQTTPKVWTWGAPVGNLWRTTGDISDNWTSMIGKTHTNDDLAQYAGPGHWNDPDMLEVGNGGMTDTEYRTHFSLWAMMAAPLLVGSDLRNPSAQTLTILKNTDIIALDQDPAGKQATIVSSSSGLVVYTKVLANGDRGVALLNETGATATISTTAAAIGMGASASYNLKNLWTKANSTTTGTISASVPSHGTVVYRVSRGTPPPATRLEAENATISQGVVEANHAGFSGTGFVNGDNVVGSYVDWTVNAASAGTATIEIGYSNGTTTNRPMDVVVNGSVVSPALAFPSTGTWDTWPVKSLSVPLNAGSNSIRLVATTVNGGPNLDYLDPGTTGSPPVTTRYEAEGCSPFSVGTTVDSNHLGYSGTGFVNTTNAVGSFIQCTVNAGSAGSATVVFRYANSGGVDRPQSVSVNGTVTHSSLSFPATANWDTWATVTVTVPLAAGANTIRLTATTAGGCPNLDYVEVTI